MNLREQLVTLQTERLSRWFQDALDVRGTEFTAKKQERWWEEQQRRERLEVEMNLEDSA